ncbi:HEAT repeat domain-containing protein [Nostoc sp. CHAB 5834]|nr:HEAT repeat domain-containing protein [Nostoc sp. CHAB 5834]
MTNIISVDLLKAVIAGQDTSLARSEAMQLLLTTDAPDKFRAYEAILLNDKEDSRFRHMSALYLGHLREPGAINALIAGTETNDPTTLMGVMRTLGRVGDASVISAIEKAAARSSGAALRQANFATTLISYRLNLPGTEIPLPTEREFLPVPSSLETRTQSIEITSSIRSELSDAIDAINQEPIGILISEAVGWKLQCQSFQWMFLLNEEFDSSQKMTKLMERKAMTGIMMLKSVELGKYQLALSMLTSPSIKPNELNVLVYDNKGRLSYAGVAQLGRGTLQFSIRAVRGGASLPVLLEGNYDGKSFLASTAQTAVSLRQARREPQPA